MSFGKMAVDWEQRVDFDKLRRERVEKANKKLQEYGIGSAMVFQFESRRYLSSWFAHPYGRHLPQEYMLFIKDKNDRLRGDIGRRILFPVYGGDHDLVSWLARAIDDRVPKYFNAPDSEASRTLWPYVPPRGKQGIIVEGLVDSLALRRHGFASYATLGKKISYDQIELLKRWGVTSVVLFWDKKDAKKEMLKAIETLKLHFDEVLVPDFTEWPADKDSGDTLNWEPGVALLKDMLTNKLIDVNSLEFATWQLS